MIQEFTDRRPALSAVLIALLFTLVPGTVMLGTAYATGGRENAAGFILGYTLFLQTLLWIKVERPILNLLPFILSLMSFIVSEVVYTVSLSMAPIGAGPGLLAMLISSALVSHFGTVAAGSVGGLLLAAILAILKKLWEFLRP